MKIIKFFPHNMFSYFFAKKPLLVVGAKCLTFPSRLLMFFSHDPLFPGIRTEIPNYFPAEILTWHRRFRLLVSVSVSVSVLVLIMASKFLINQNWPPLQSNEMVNDVFLSPDVLSLILATIILFTINMNS